MSSKPLRPATHAVMFPDESVIFVRKDGVGIIPPEGTWIASGAFPLEEGWFLIVALRSDDGEAQVVHVAMEYLGGPSIPELDDRLEALNTRLMDEPRPSIGFRYRWVRDIRQQYEDSLRQLLTEEMFGTFKRRPRERRGDLTPLYYAQLCDRYLTECGSSINDLADLEKIPYTTAKERIERAVEDGLLTKAGGGGKRGGRSLTLKARRLLYGVDQEGR